MRRYEPSALLSAHWKFVLIIGLLAAVLAVGFSLFSPLEYRSSSRLLITPYVSSAGEVFDQYTALKSAEQMVDTLTQIIHTTLFQNRVLQSPYDIKAERFESEPRERRKEWAKKVKPEITPGTGVLVVSVYDVDPVRSREITEAVSETLVNGGKDYLPGQVKITLIDPPLVSKYPVRPNLLFRALLGLLFGAFFASAYTILHPHNRRHDEFGLLP